MIVTAWQFEFGQWGSNKFISVESDQNCVKPSAERVAKLKLAWPVSRKRSQKEVLARLPLAVSDSNLICYSVFVVRGA